MSLPGEYSNPVQEARDLKDQKVSEAYQQGHDAEIPPSTANNSTNVDIEKAIPSQAGSTHSDERTLSEDLPKEAQAQEAADPDLVDWDGPDDPKNPQNWPDSKKWGMIAVLAAVTLVTPLGSSFFAPGVPQVMRDFGVTSNLLASFVVSVYILGFALGPLIIAPMSELYGRLWIYNICNVLFVIFTICCAVSNSMGMLVAFRLLAGCAGSAPLTIGGGTIADLFPQEKRAGAMAIWSMGPLLGPVVGPVAGGFLAEAKGWRWVFWILSIVAGAFSILFASLGRETYAPTLLAQKAARLRKETGNQNLKSKLALDIPPKEVFVRAVVRPMKMLIFSPIVLLMALYVAVNYGILYLLFTTITFVFERKYGFSSGSVGLTFIGCGVGMFIGMAFLGTMSDKIIKEKQAKGTVKPEHRLPVILTVPGGICLPIGIFLYGWTTDKGVHWIVPIIGTAFFGIGNLSALMTVQTYMVDAFTVHAASAIAANTVLRSIFGAVFPLFGLNLFDSLGLGWGNSLLGFIALAMIPVPVFFRYYGERIRTNPKFQVNL
ncbi:MFS general substrate transporter [Aaosphaeria arxii CBS 175.79]|uniref:MFS general substrate transporter n=1 Tax=Aaosphaeria arxii CBS 175.79 TaxID=1450172 RepID=A0A6A5XS43_9PLEO|nr:MFS general substrate transporter [Aaosphaeria arxii CBS 175.79]KAF2015716.1 MFS general substrate transporter [Aaosphaeria arxii CBS 175.79]